MEGLGAEYGAVEWTIDNFSCWNATIHHEVITSLNFFGEFHFEIRPRGGWSYPMSVRMLGDSRAEISGDLSLIASDGYVFCSEEVEINSQGAAFELSSVPGFEYIVAHSKMIEGSHEDLITLRFQKREAVSDSVLYMRTVICVHEFSISIPGEAIYEVYLDGIPPRSIRTIEYTTNDGATAKIHLHAGFGNVFNRGNMFGVRNPKAMYFKMKQTGSHKTAFIRSRISVIGKNGKVVRSKANEQLCGDDKYLTVSNFLTRTEVEEEMFDLLWRLRIIPENKSELLCTYDTCVEKPSENNKADTSCQPENSMEVLTQDFMCLYQDQKFSDITLKCDNVTFPVHKVILSARSPVLDRMLSSDMKEAASGEVDIEDLDFSTLSRFLTYLYTGSVEDLQDDSALKLYYAADKYQVPSLMRDCSKFLCANVSVSNVCEILSLADKHCDDQLTSAAHDFILKNFSKVLSCDEWGSLVKSDSLLVAKTLTHLAQKKYGG